MPGLSKRVVLHIGTHKTGTTSLQRALSKNSRLLRSAGIRFYRGLYKPANHVELQLAAMRFERRSPFKRRMDRVPVDEAFRANVIAHVQSFLALCPEQKFIFSAEGLSYLRLPEETAVLGRIFEGHSVEVIVYFRDKRAFLESYSRQIGASRALRNMKDSWAYCGDDSWLIDYDGLLQAYSQQFGASAIKVRSYEADKEVFGGTVGSFLALLGLAGEARSLIGEPKSNVTRLKPKRHVS